MKIDPYKHKEQYLKWKDKAQEKGIGDITQDNSKIIIQYLVDMENGINVASSSVKGSRSYIRLNTLRQKLRFFALKFQKLYNLSKITEISENQLCRFFSDMRNGTIRKQNGAIYQSTAYFVKNFKSFWHWWMKVNRKQGKEIKDIRDQVIKETAVNLEKQKGTAKGIEFEEEVYSTLQTLASYYENTVELTGTQSKVGSKKGDILIELENKKKVIIECKDSSSYSTKKTIDEINASIQNRNASFGIFLFAKRNEMPRELCPIKITDKYIITYYDEDNLYFAYRIARLFALKNSANSEDKIDFAKISSELNTMEDNFKNIDSMQVKATTIINSGEYVRKNLNLLRENIEKSVKKIKDEMCDKYEGSN